MTIAFPDERFGHELWQALNVGPVMSDHVLGQSRFEEMMFRRRDDRGNGDILISMCHQYQMEACHQETLRGERLGGHRWVVPQTPNDTSV